MNQPHAIGLIDLLRQQFESRSSAPAIRIRDRTISYGELAARAEKAGAFLQSQGLEKGDRVVLYTPQKLPFLIAHLGVLLSGGISLPLNFRFTPDEMVYFLNDSEARFVVASGQQAELVAAIRDRCPSLRAILDPQQFMALEGGRTFREVALSPEDPGLILYSSGTTGRPKGVVHTHRNLAASLLALQRCWAFTPDDILLNVLPLFHIHGLSFAAHLALISGGLMIVEDRFHPLRTMARIREATVFMAVPPFYYAFLRRPEFREHARAWSRVRLFTCGSAPIRPEVLPELESILGRSLINRYGMTESHVITSLPLSGPFKQGSVGLPLDGIEMKLVAEDDSRVSAGARNPDGTPRVGEVRIRGPNLFSHYWNKPEATAEAFDAEGFFATGDLGYLDEDGYLTLVGRKTDLIITGGYNVYPAVVERVLNAFPQVRESAVIGLPDARRGERVVAVIVPEGDLDLRALRRHCQARLVDYQRPVQFELVDALPRNTMGKVLKRTLRERFAP